MSIDVQNIEDAATVRADQGGQINHLSGLELNRINVEDMIMIAGIGEQGMQESNISYCEENYSGTVPAVKTDFANVQNSIGTLACEFNNPYEISKLS